MTKILAAIDNGPTARLVLQTAMVVARAVDADVEAIHVRENGFAIAEEIARELGVTFRLIETKPLDQLIAELDAPDVAIAVVGARTHPDKGGLAGHVAVMVAEQSAKPVVIVPPAATVCRPGEMRKILMPLDGTVENARAARAAVRMFSRAGVEVVALHVFDKATTPQFLDHPGHDFQEWTREFLARFCAEPGSRLELRTGRIGDRVAQTAEEQGANMIALAWSQNLSPGRSMIVRKVLSQICLPVMLVPEPQTVPRIRRGAGAAARAARRVVSLMMRVG